MSKRSATSSTPGTPTAKRFRGVGPDDLYLDEPEDDATTAHSPESAIEAESPQTTNTAATTPRPKFPSDLKTLACTWPGCPKTFNRPARLRDHLNSHTNSRPFKCPYDDCDKDYIEDKHLKQHIKAVHTLERKHVCPKEGCGKSFVTGTRLKRHQAVHEGEERFRCRDCGQSFRKKETLHKHIRKDHQGLPAHQCSEEGCNIAFDSKAALKRHRDREHGEAKFWCSECSSLTLVDGAQQRVGFTTEALLLNHVRQEHQNCMFCDFISASRWGLERHVEMHHTGQTLEDRKNIECPYTGCIKRFTKKSNLNAHVRTAHEGFRFVCGAVDLTSVGLRGWSNEQGCGDKFSTKVRLEDHIRYTHLGQERPKLSRTESSQTLDVIDEISGAAIQAERNIVCPHCNEAFIRYHDFDIHTQLFHEPLAHDFSADPALLLSQAQLDAEQVLFDNNFAGSMDWPDVMQNGGSFAAQMDYGPHDDWPEDEANLMLLARDPQAQDALIDPSLGIF